MWSFIFHQHYILFTRVPDDEEGREYESGSKRSARVQERIGDRWESRLRLRGTLRITCWKQRIAYSISSTLLSYYYKQTTQLDITKTAPNFLDIFHGNLFMPPMPKTPILFYLKWLIFLSKMEQVVSHFVFNFGMMLSSVKVEQNWNWGCQSMNVINYKYVIIQIINFYLLHIFCWPKDIYLWGRLLWEIQLNPKIMEFQRFSAKFSWSSFFLVILYLSSWAFTEPSHWRPRNNLRRDNGEQVE